MGWRGRRRKSETEGNNTNKGERERERETKMVRRRRSCSQLSIQVTLPTSRSIMRSPLERIPPQGSPMPRLLPFTFIFRFLCVFIQYIGSCVTKSSSSSSWRRSKSEGRNDGSFFDSMSRRLVVYSVRLPDE